MAYVALDLSTGISLVYLSGRPFSHCRSLVWDVLVVIYPTGQERRSAAGNEADVARQRRGFHDSHGLRLGHALRRRAG